MAIRTIYCDESGFTGYNLLDPAQPIFVVASAGIDEQRANDTLKEPFPDYRGSDFKFTNIWHSRNRAGLLTFARHLAEFGDLGGRVPGGGAGVPRPESESTPQR